MNINTRLVILTIFTLFSFTHSHSQAPAKLSPLLNRNEPVKWFFVFKFNTTSFPKCADAPAVGSGCLFGGSVKDYPKQGQEYVFASSKNPALVKGNSCAGATDHDPLGATFGQVYLHDGYNFVIWNDQFKGKPITDGSGASAHSKGMLAWDENGDGFVMQVTTPSWPASGSSSHPRVGDGNTLGCIDDDNIEVSQHFFCLKINKADLIKILNACINANVHTNISKKQLVHNGGPSDVQALVRKLGVAPDQPSVLKFMLSSGVQIISKPHTVAAPPWQLVSSELGALPLRVATWWQAGKICSTTASTLVPCLPDSKRSGAVQIALTGTWDQKSIGLTGGPNPGGNHAKIGVSTNKQIAYSIFGDMNQEGTLKKINGSCESRQNGRGGLFYVVDNQLLFENVSALLKGDTAPTNCN